jgi:hypothetical protein
MFKLKNWKFGLIILATLIMMGPGIVSLAQEPERQDSKRTDLIRLMLDHGREAYERGLYEKAGYYFLQAVKNNPADMAFQWYEFCAGTKGQKKD